MSLLVTNDRGANQGKGGGRFFKQGGGVGKGLRDREGGRKEEGGSRVGERTGGGWRSEK